jgi:hypothetical protein
MNVVRHPNGFDVKVWSGLLISYATYHRRLGFAGTLVYVRDDFLADFVGNAEIRRAIEEKLLFLVRWDDFATFPDLAAGEQVYDQVGTSSSWRNNLRLQYQEPKLESLHVYYRNDRIITPCSPTCINMLPWLTGARILCSSWPIATNTWP